MNGLGSKRGEKAFIKGICEWFSNISPNHSQVPKKMGNPALCLNKKVNACF
jgi:hypothetical protein